MLPKKNRLKKRKDFERVFKEGKRYNEKFLFLVTAPNHLSFPRFGFVVNLKVSKKATVRNKIKRRLREIIRGFLPEIKKGIDCVIVARPEIKEATFQEMKEVLSRLIKKIIKI